MPKTLSRPLDSTQVVSVDDRATAGTLIVWLSKTSPPTGLGTYFDESVREPSESVEEWAPEDILTPEVLAEFHRASARLLARRSE
jgi:hypothetical protein